MLVLMLVTLVVSESMTNLTVVPENNECFAGLPKMEGTSLLHLFQSQSVVDYISPVYIVTKPNQMFYLTMQKPDVIVFFLGNVEDFKSALKGLRAARTWNSRAHYLVYTSDKRFVSEIFIIGWKYYLLNLNVIDIATREVFRYYPYEIGYCGDTSDYDYVGQCSSEEQYNFPNKIPIDLHGCEVKLMPYKIQPYVLDLKAPREDPSLAGLEVTIVHVLSQRMNFTEKYVRNPHIHWGYRFSDGSYSLMFKSLYDEETDVIFGFTYGNASYTIDFDSSFSHVTESSVWYVPTALTIPQWKNLTAIFEARLWYAIFGVLIANGLAWWVLGRKTEVSLRDLSISLMASMYVLLQGSIQSPVSWRLRGLFALWLFTCLLIFTAHQCQLISILTSPIYEHQMTSVFELVHSNLEYGFYPTIEDAYNDNTSWLDRTILANYQTCPLTTECLNRTAFKRDFAVVKNRRQVMYLMPRYYTFPNGRAMLFELEEIAFSSKPRYHTKKGFPFLQRWDQLLMWLCENGLIDKWDKDSKHKVIKIEAEPDHEPLSLGHLQGAFLVLTFGMLMSLLVFICELVRAKCCKKY